METFIVLIPNAENTDARADCELISNTNFTLTWKKRALLSLLVLDAVKKITDSTNTEVWRISEFMDYCNDQEVDMDKYFMSYVHAEMR
jgi:hypothetical protein